MLRMPPPPIIARLLNVLHWIREAVGAAGRWLPGQIAQALRLVGKPQQGRRWLARGAVVVALVTLLAGLGGPLVTWSGAAYAHGATSQGFQGSGGAPWKADPGKPNHLAPNLGVTSAPTATPTTTATKPPLAPTPGAPLAPHPILHSAIAMRPGLLALSPTAPATFRGSDGLFEVDAPAGAVTPADAAAAGGVVQLSITQIAPGGGSSAGGSGLVSFGSYLIQVVDARGVLLTHGLRKPVQVAIHYGARSALDLTTAFVVFNGALPVDMQVAPIGLRTGAARPGGRGLPGGASLLIYPASVTPATIGLGARSSQHTQLDLKGQRITTTATVATPSSTMTFESRTPVAVFGQPDPFNTDLSAGGLTTSIPLEAPAGPGGLTPPVALSYSSASVNEQHNPQGAAGWVGEGWNLSFGSISWTERNGTADCVSSCGNTWEDSWQLSDPFGTAAELIPPNINAATYFDNSANYFCNQAGANSANSLPCPIAWHTAPETRAKIYSFISGLSLPDGAGDAPPCFRVFLPNGIMEEFGCTADSLEYYYTPGAGNNTPGMGDYISSWNLDLITDPHGNQIHITYQQDAASKDYTVNGTDYGVHTSIRDAAPATVEWDSPTCQNAQTMCVGAAWAPLMRVSFAAAHSATRITNSPANCNTGVNLRCDDPLDLSGSGGLAAPLVQSDFVLNDALTQARSSGSASWNTLKDYQFSYAVNGPAQVTDDVTGDAESVAGYFDLTQVQEFAGSSSLPAQTFAYEAHDQVYEDSSYFANADPGCGVLTLLWWNTSCLLWEVSYAGNDQYLHSADNGMGMQTTFSWSAAFNNTHGVNGGGGNAANPFYCASLTGSSWGAYPCSEAADQNWSRIVLTQQTSTVYQALSSGNTAVPSTTSYNYSLTYPLAAEECSDCVAGMYWGNQNDGDYLDYYNGKFMGFAETDVTNPDQSVEQHKFYATNGYGVYDTAQVAHCYSNYTCHDSAWWAPGNALHGHEYEVDSYDTDGVTLLSKNTTAYSVSCPPAGVGGTPASSAWGNWNGNLVSELDHNNPVAACEIHTSETDAYTYDGGSSGPHTTTLYTYSYDGAGHMAWSTQYTTVNGSEDGSPTSYTDVQDFAWNDAISATSTSASGTYLIGFPDWTSRNDGNGYAQSCSQIWYDNGAWGGNQLNSLIYGDATTTTRYATTCGSAANNWVSAGPVSVNQAYDSYGNPIGSTDADANAGIAGHQGCTIGSHQYTDCAAFDTTFEALPTSATNTLNQTSSTGYSQAASGGFGLWPVATTDANGQTTSYSYDALGRLIGETLPGETSAPTTSWAYTDWCAPMGAQTACLEVDQTQRVTSTTTITRRAFYDGWGQLVETRTPGPSTQAGGQDVIVYAEYDSSGRVVAQSQPYFVAAYTGAPGSAAFATPDTTQPRTVTTYTTLRQTSVQDALSHVTTTTRATQCGVGNDSGCYVVTTVVDPEGHQQATLTDGWGRDDYAFSYTGTSGATYQQYAETTTGYDFNGAVKLIIRSGVPNAQWITLTNDLLGRQTALSDPDRGNEAYSYDANGNLTKTVDARGVSGTTYAGYDGLNRPLWRNTTNSPTGAYATYSYDATAGDNEGVGRLTGESFSNANVGGALSGGYATTYDARGQVTRTSETLAGGSPFTTSASYNDAGELTSQSYPNGDTLTTSYDPASGWASGESVQLSGANTATPLVSDEGYTAQGQLTSATLGAFTGGSGGYTASYDALGRLTTSSYSYTPTGQGTSTLFSVQPTYDALGNVIETTTTLPQGTDTQVFCYDDLARLVWAGSSGTPACSGAPTPSDTGSLSGTGATYSASYAYDVQNRLTSGPLGGYVYGDGSHVDAATSISAGGGAAWSASYDAAGNMTCRAATSATTCAGASPTGALLSYDNEGRLTGWQSTPTIPLQSASYLYDGEGNRVEQVATAGGGASTTTSYIGSLEEVTSSGSGTTTTTAYYGGLAERVNGALSYTLSDGLGSVSAAVSASGATSGQVSATQLYGPYGSVRYSSGTLPTDKGYTGQRSDASTSGLDYYGARYYDPAAGQFTSADTWQAGGLNEYGYVGGNPETYIDPSGHEERVGDNGAGGGMSGGEGTPGGGQSSGANWGGSGNDSGMESGLPPPMTLGDEQLYDAGSPGADAFHLDANGAVDGVDGPDGQLLETNEEIRAQAEADATDRLSLRDLEGQEKAGENQQGNTVKSSGDELTPTPSGDPSMPTASQAGTGNKDVVEVTLDGTRYPETAGHIQEAIDDGQPEELTIDRDGANANRRASLKGFATQTGFDRDEYPLAMTMEGGEGADIRYIDPSDNRGAGSSIGSQLRGLPDGTRFRITILWEE